MGFDQARVVQIWSPAAPGHWSSGGLAGSGSNGAGSGYRVSEGLVLTAAHVVAGHPMHEVDDGAPQLLDSAGVGVAVLGSSEWVPAVVVWRNEDADVAVLYATGLPGLPAGSPAPRWGIVTGHEQVECMAVGFPWAAVTPHQLRDTEHVVGFIPPVSGAVTGVQAITVRSSPPLPRGGGSPWAGMSGAGVFCGRYLVGVIVVDPARYGTDRLRAIPLAPLLESNEQMRTMLGACEQLEPVRLPPRLAISAQDTLGLRPPYLPLSEDDRAEASAVMLQAKYGLVPFSGRAEQLTELQGWCRHDGALLLRVVTGDGGAGKTRLAAELCAVMAIQGWDTGFAKFNRPGGEVVDDYDRPTLVVVDDAEQQVSLVNQLLESLAYRNAGAAPVRVLLLSRNLQVWWELLDLETEELAERRASAVLDLHAGELGAQERAHQYHSSHAIWWQFRGSATTSGSANDDSSPGEHEADAVSQRPGPPVSGQGPDPNLDLTDPAFANPLLVHMTALLHVFPASAADQLPGFSGSSGDSETQARPDVSAKKPVRERILQGVLKQEKRRWVRIPDGPKFSLMGMQQAVALTTLSAPTDKSVLTERLVALPDLLDASLGDRRMVADWLHQLYPGPEPPWVVPLRPDLLAEELLASTEELLCIANAVLAQTIKAGDITVISRILDELVRASRRDPVREVLNRLLKAHLPVILDQALVDSSGQIPSVLDRALRAAPQPVQAYQHVDRLPERSIILASLAVCLTQQAVDHLRNQIVTDSETFTPNLARAINNLSNRLAQVGRWEEAWESAEEATRIYRDLNSAYSKTFTPGLARALITLSNGQAQVGQQQKALESAEEAARIYRGLAAADSGTFTGGFAGALSTLSNALAEMSRWEEASEWAEEAARIYRGLAAADPGAFTGALALALNNLSINLAHLGQKQEALEWAEEATRIYRDLDNAHPGAFTGDFAGALHTLSNALAEVGRWEQALESAEEATSLWRGFVAAHPKVFTPGLARALSTLSSAFAEVGQQQEAMASAEEAARIYRDLGNARPGDFTGDFAGALRTLSSAFAEVGRQQEALESAEEAARIYRGLIAADPGAFTEALADALNNLSIHLAHLGWKQEAVESADEATGIYRDLDTACPGAFTSDLALTLKNLSIHLAQMGRWEEALEAAEEATRIYRTLVAVNPEEFTPALAQGLKGMGVYLTVLKRPLEALKVDREVLLVYAQFARKEKNVIKEVRNAVSNLTIDLRDLGYTDDEIRQELDSLGIDLI